MPCAHANVGLDFVKRPVKMSDVLVRTTDDPKTRRITVRVNAETFARLQRRAKRKGVTVGEVVRGLLAGDDVRSRASKGR